MTDATDRIDDELQASERTDDGATAGVNRLLKAAAGFEFFVELCSEAVESARDLNLPVIDLANGETGNEFYGNAKIAYRKNAFGEGLDESVMRAVKTYVPTGDLKELRKLVSSMRAYAKLAGRVSHMLDCDDDMAKIESAARVKLAQVATIDPTLWNVYASTDGKQHLSGLAQSLLEVDGHWQTTSMRDNGQCEHTRNDPTAQPYVRNGKAFHAYVQVQGSVSERDIASL